MDEQKKNTSPVLEPLLTKNDLQQFLRVSSRTLVRLIESGELPAPLKVGCRARWRVSDVTRFIGAGSGAQQFGKEQVL